MKQKEKNPKGMKLGMISELLSDPNDDDFPKASRALMRYIQFEIVMVDD
jgi:hypothetical protein